MSSTVRPAVTDEILFDLLNRGPMQDKKKTAAFGNIDGLVSQIPNKYLLVNAARVRAQQVVNGAEPLVEGSNPEKAVSTAFAEIAAGKLELTTEPARPEEQPD